MEGQEQLCPPAPVYRLWLRGRQGPRAPALHHLHTNPQHKRSVTGPRAPQSCRPHTHRRLCSGNSLLSCYCSSKGFSVRRAREQEKCHSPGNGGRCRSPQSAAATPHWSAPLHQQPATGSAVAGRNRPGLAPLGQAAGLRPTLHWHWSKVNIIPSPLSTRHKKRTTRDQVLDCPPSAPPSAPQHSPTQALACALAPQSRQTGKPKAHT